MPTLPSLTSGIAFGDLTQKFPAHSVALFGFVEDLMRGPGVWDIADRELFAAYVSGLNACTFCFGTHKVFAEAFGIDPGVIEALLTDIDSAPVDEHIRAVCRYLNLINTMPAKLTQADMDAVLAAGVGEDALIEAVMVGGLFNMMNRIMDGLGVDKDFISDTSAHPVAKLGDAARDHHFVAPKS